ncbi:MAG: MATE family efflux transporter, partial [Lachnospiraceae bacterium]|nr:MATE family efflux transporter [Lachnospiraceae bacterium]
SVSKTLLRFFFPMLLTNILQQVYSFADMVIIGKGIGDNALAAVGNFTTIAFFMTGFIMGITNGFSVNIAHSYGEENRPSLRKVIAASINLSVIFAISFTILGLSLLNPVLKIAKTDASIMNDCLSYGYVILGGLFITVAFNLVSSVLRAIGDSKTPFLAISISSVINILLDLCTIYIFDSGVEGPAYATVFSQLLSVFICCLKLHQVPELKLKKEDFSIDFRLNIELLKNRIPMACMNSITSIGCIFVQSCINAYGVIYTSAYSACSKYLNLFMLPGITAGFSISAFTGQNFGAKKYSRIRLGVKTACCIAFISSLLLGTALYCFSFQLAALMLTGESAVEYTAGFLRYFAFTLILLNLLFVFRSCVQGLGKPLLPTCSGIVEMLIRIPVIYIGLPIYGFRATAYAEGLAWAGALTINLIAYIHFFFCIRHDEML